MDLRLLVVASFAVPTLATAQVVSTTGTVLFGTRAHETVLSGIGGSQTANGNESGVINRYGVSLVTPASPSPDASELVNFGALVAFYGDTNLDGVHAENPDHGGAEAIDAIWVPAGLSTPARWSDFFHSPGVDLGGGGGLAGVPIKATEMVMIQVSGPPLKLYTEADLETLLGMTAGALAPANVDGFAKDVATGNLYLSFSGGVTINGSTGVAAGDLVEIAGTHYTPAGVHGVVTAPTSGGARVAATAAQFQALMAHAGVGTTGPLQLRDIDVDPAGGTWTNPLGTLPHLMFVADGTGPNAAAIYTTQNSGAFAVVNGVVMRNANTLGLSTRQFNGLPASSLDVLDVVAQVQTRLPVALDTFPNASGGSNPVSPLIVTPGPVTFGAAGIERLGPGAMLLVGIGPTGVGTCAYRTSSTALGLQGSALLQVDFLDPVFAFFANPSGLSPIPIVRPTIGHYAKFDVQLPFHVPAGVSLAFQLLDLSDLTLSNANVVRF